jgi:outer membrane protein OmpA-like peptidoglycan-associated protein
MKTLNLTAAATVLGAVLGGCASQPPPELKNARTAYQEAAQSQGAMLAAPDVYEAKKSLEVAERAFADDGDEPETRDLAYVADRKALIARSKGNTALAMQQQRAAMAEADRLKEQQAVATREQLGQKKEELARSQAQLDSERQARQDELSKIQGLTTKQDERGLVMTISGSVLFTTGKSELLPTAQKRLGEVANALKDTPRSLTVIGHTDSTGTEQKNQVLSQRRAEVVRTFLITHGIAEDRVEAQGVGEHQPIASNKSAEGRANNRRVEIIMKIEPKEKSQPGTGKP